MDNLSRFARNLKTIRKSKGLTQGQLAKKLDLSNQTIINYEKDVSFPTGKGINKICDVLGVTSDELLGTVSLKHESEKRMVRLVDTKAALRFEFNRYKVESEKVAFLFKFLESENLESSTLFEICNEYLNKQISTERDLLENDFYEYRNVLNSMAVEDDSDYQNGDICSGNDEILATKTIDVKAKVDNLADKIRESHNGSGSLEINADELTPNEMQELADNLFGTQGLGKALWDMMDEE